jgi:MYXO-CTERM domain-containing protein
MKSIACFLVPLTAAAALLVVPSSANAHVRLLDPPPRVDGEAGGDQLKQGPCGQTPNGRTDIVSVFAPGETITVSWAEYIDHPGYYRIAFDVDGDDDFPLRPNESVSQNGDDPTIINPVSDASQDLDSYILDYFLDDVAATPGSEEEYSTTVTLPNIECENCTLQVIQFMYGRQAPYYFQCADLALRADAATADSTVSTGTMSTGTSSTTGTESSSTTGTTGEISSSTTGFATSTGSVTSGTTTSPSTTGTDSGATVGSTTGVPAATMTTTGAAATTGVGGTGAGVLTGGVAQAQPQPEEPGCSCRVERPAPFGAWPLVLLGLGLVGYRRRSHWR